MYFTEKQLLETICFQIQRLKPENIPRPPYILAAPKDSSPPVAKSTGGGSGPTPSQSSNSKGKQSANTQSLTKSKSSTALNQETHLTQKGGRRLPIPPEPLPSLTNRVSTYSPAISTGILIEAVKAGMSNPEAGLLPGGGPAGNIPKGKRKVVRVRG
jgi:signal recognition particle subunit SRP19